MTTTFGNLRGGFCTFSYTIFNVTVSEVNIITQPQNGSLETVAPKSAKYIANGGFKGMDRFTIQYCGDVSGKKRCETSDYNLMVN